MSLSSQAVDRLFDRLAATYGRQWMNMWDGVDANAVKSLWAHELSPFSVSLARIAWALENLPARCPNAIEFKLLCRQAPEPQGKFLPEPKADPERVQEELAKLGEIRNKPIGLIDGKDWARRILGRYEGGAKINYATLKMAKEALGISREA